VLEARSAAEAETELATFVGDLAPAVHRWRGTVR
jgi:hypothetical protein